MYHTKVLLSAIIHHGFDDLAVHYVIFLIELVSRFLMYHSSQAGG